MISQCCVVYSLVSSVFWHKYVYQEIFIEIYRDYFIDKNCKWVESTSQHLYYLDSYSKHWLVKTSVTIFPNKLSSISFPLSIKKPREYYNTPHSGRKGIFDYFQFCFLVARSMYLNNTRYMRSNKVSRQKN